MPRGIKHSREEIISGIQQAIQEGADLRTSQVQNSRYRWAYRSFPNHFDSWPQALEEAGTSYQEVKSRAEAPRKDARKQKWIEELKKAYQAGVDLSASSLQKDDEHRNLYERGKSFFPGRLYWETALRAAELPVEEIIKQQEWTRDKVILRLKERQAAGLPMNQEAVGNSLSKAAARRFGSYDSALKAIGLDPKKYRANNPTSKTEIVTRIIQAHLKGRDLNLTRIVKNPRNSLRRFAYAAEKKFDGGWVEAVETAGIDYSVYRQKESQGFWNPRTVIARIKKLRDKGEDLSATNVNKNHSGLHHAACRYIGSWDEALEAAEISPEEVRQKTKSFSKDQIKRFLRCLDNFGVRLNTTSVVSDQEATIRSLYTQGISKFGNWRKALEASGLDTNEILRKGEYTLEEITEAVKDWQEKGLSLKAREVQTDKERRWVHKTVCRRHHSWYNFLEQIGIDPSAYRDNLEEKEAEKAEIAQEIADLNRGGLDLSVTGVLGKEDQSLNRLLWRAVKKFGSWSKAVEASGVDYASVRKRRGDYTKEELKQIVRDLEQKGTDLNASAIQQSPETARLHLAASRRYDSWYDLLQEAGIDPKPYRKQEVWTREKIIAELRGVSESGVIESTKQIGPSLYDAIKRHFNNLAEAAKQAELVLCVNGRITRDMLQDPNTIGIIYRHNQEFLEKLAGSAFFRAKFAGRKTLDQEDLASQAFLTLINLLPEKPRGKSLRDFARKRIASSLAEENRQASPEARFGDEVYFDLFRDKSQDVDMQEEIDRRIDAGESLEEILGEDI